jgi:metallo-beta-lactamase class B
MKQSMAFLFLIALMATSHGAMIAAQTAKDTVEAHVAAAKAAADGQTALVNLCNPPAPAGARSGQPSARAGQPPAPPDRSRWQAEPVKVFDNLYYVGEKEYSAWAVTTSEGIIIVDAIYEYSVQDQIVGGLKKLGLDPSMIKYVVVSHAHRDHAGGAWHLQERFGARVILSAADWEMLERTAGGWPKPKRDMIATDGQRLSLGDTTLTFYLTPGHTPGTISTLIPVRDNGKPHLALLWGGTGFNFTVTPERPRDYWFDAYIKSAERIRDIVTKSGADVFLSNHPSWDGSVAKMAALTKRKQGDSHPYVIGNDSLRRQFTVAAECARAGRLH